MNHLVLGHNSSGKTTLIKERLQDETARIVVLDFNDAYDDFADHRILLDHINPLMSPIGLDEVRALNAGYIHNSRCLLNQCEELLREFHGSKAPLDSYKQLGLIEEAILRMQVSWNQVDTAYAKILSSRIPMKVSKRHVPMEEAIDNILSHDRTLLKMKSMYSDHLRAVTFMLLTKLSQVTDEKIIIVADDQSTLFNQGNVRMFLQTLDLEKFDFYLAFNKATNVPKDFLPLLDHYHILRFENNAELKELDRLRIIDDTSKKFKLLKNGQYISYNKKEHIYS